MDLMIKHAQVVVRTYLYNIIIRMNNTKKVVTTLSKVYPKTVQNEKLLKTYLTKQKKDGKS